MGRPSLCDRTPRAAVSLRVGAARARFNPTGEASRRTKMAALKKRKKMKLDTPMYSKLGRAGKRLIESCRKLPKICCSV